MLSQEQKDRLTPEELVIAEKWEIEKAQQVIIFDEILAAIEANSMELVILATEKLGDLTPSQCEHGRHVMCGCMACDELERKVYPDSFANCNSCGESVNKEELENGRCIDCPEDSDGEE